MPADMEIRIPCREGTLVLTETYARLVPRGPFPRKSRWYIERGSAVGVSLHREGARYCAAVRTRSGDDLMLTRLLPLDALRLARLLGYAAGQLAASGDSSTSNGGPRVRCQGGTITLSGDTLAFVPGLRLRRAEPWAVAMDQVSGISSLRQPGVRLLHDLEIHTRNGQTYQVRRVRPDAALRLLDALGYIPGAMPEQPQDQRDALEMQFALPDGDEEQAPSLPAILTGTDASLPSRSLARDLDDLWERRRTATSA